ncbi:MAG: lipoyl(octanoyl) transferase LipB, partial [Steroidobacteraceae bacterium]
LVVYPLIDLKRLGLGVRALVVALENALVALLAQWNIPAAGRRDAPGIYVAGRKLASIGLRIRRGCSYHGLAFNVAMDLEPFSRINPCGYRGLEVIDLNALGVALELRTVADLLAPHLLEALGLPSAAEWAAISSSAATSSEASPCAPSS